MKVIVATMAFGSRCRNMMTVLLTPSAWAARTYSKLRALRNSARTTPTKPIQENSNSRPSSHQKLGSTTLARMISRYSVGSPDHTSMKRWPKRSVHPPK